MGRFSFWENMRVLSSCLARGLLRWPARERDARALALSARVGVGDGDFVAGLVREDDRLDVARAAHRPPRGRGDHIAGNESRRCCRSAGDDADDRRALARRRTALFPSCTPRNAVAPMCTVADDLPETISFAIVVAFPIGIA